MTNKKSRFSMEQLGEKVGNIIDGLRHEPLRVCVMGQTGVGKSSLINAVFGTSFNVDPVRTGTTKIEERVETGKNGQQVLFIDIPGVGESIENDSKIIPEYQKYLNDSDVVLWAILADTRSFMYDRISIDEVLGGLDPEQKKILFSKIVFVLTKTDILTDPEQPAHWWLVKNNTHDCFFIPDNRLESLIKRKEEYFQSAFISPYKSLIRSRTYCSASFKVKIQGMSHKKRIVQYDGYVDEVLYQQWSQAYPKQEAVFRRLYEGCQIIPCSSLFKFNLNPLMNSIISKLDTRSADRLKGFVENEYLNRLSHSQASSYANIVPIELDKLKEVLQAEGEK